MNQRFETWWRAGGSKIIVNIPAEAMELAYKAGMVEAAHVAVMSFKGEPQISERNRITSKIVNTIIQESK